MDILAWFWEELRKVLTTEVLVTAAVVAGAQESVKQAIGRYKRVWLKHPTFKCASAIAPMPLGAAIGAYAIPDGGVAAPEILGLVAGLVSSKGYDMVAPHLKMIIENRLRTIGAKAMEEDAKAAATKSEP